MTSEKEQIAKIKKRVSVLHLVTILLLAINAAVWFATLSIYYDNNLILLTVGLSCVAFLIAAIILGIFIAKRIKKDLKGLVENFAGTVSAEDIKTASELYKKWKKHYIASTKWVFNEFRKETYPFGGHIMQDLKSIKRGIRVETQAFYALLGNEDYGEIGNQLLCEIYKLIGNNSYILPS